MFWRRIEVLVNTSSTSAALSSVPGHALHPSRGGVAQIDPLMILIAVEAGGPETRIAGTTGFRL